MNKEMNRPWPIVEYARSINKNTADLTAADISNHMKKWVKQAPRKDLLTMAKSYTTKKFQDAHTSRLPIEILEQGIESPITDGVEVALVKNEVACSMDLTKADIDSLIWGLETLLNEYDLEENEIGVCFKSLLQGLKEI